MMYTTTIELETRGHADMHDLTRAAQSCLEESGLVQGMLNLFTPSSTSALTTIEYESGALADLRRALDEIAPEDQDYQHNLRWGDGNGHAHLRAALIGPNLSIPVRNGQLALGTWQQILFIDFDVRPRTRRIMVTVLGE
jgi:secondary thiamine-phosphate synthase enzyme